MSRLKHMPLVNIPSMGTSVATPMFLLSSIQMIIR